MKNIGCIGRWLVGCVDEFQKYILYRVDFFLLDGSLVKLYDPKYMMKTKIALNQAEYWSADYFMKWHFYKTNWHQIEQQVFSDDHIVKVQAETLFVPIPMYLYYKLPSTRVANLKTRHKMSKLHPSAAQTSRTRDTKLLQENEPNNFVCAI